MGYLSICYVHIHGEMNIFRNILYKGNWVCDCKSTVTVKNIDSPENFHSTIGNYIWV